MSPHKEDLNFISEATVEIRSGYGSEGELDVVDMLVLLKVMISSNSMLFFNSVKRLDLRALLLALPLFHISIKPESDIYFGNHVSKSGPLSSKCLHKDYN